MASSTPEREALCHALTRVVDQRGWTGTSPARVAYEAGLAPHEFYDHFRSLEQCYLAVYDRMLARITRTALRAVGTRGTGLGRGTSMNGCSRVRKTAHARAANAR